jgi:hypothetical protein
MGARASEGDAPVEQLLCARQYVKDAIHRLNWDAVGLPVRCAISLRIKTLDLQLNIHHAS